MPCVPNCLAFASCPSSCHEQNNTYKTTSSNIRIIYTVDSFARLIASLVLNEHMHKFACGYSCKHSSSTQINYTSQQFIVKVYYYYYFSYFYQLRCKGLTHTL